MTVDSVNFRKFATLTAIIRPKKVFNDLQLLDFLVCQINLISIADSEPWSSKAVME